MLLFAGHSKNLSDLSGEFHVPRCSCVHEVCQTCLTKIRNVRLGTLVKFDQMSDKVKMPDTLKKLSVFCCRQLNCLSLKSWLISFRSVGHFPCIEPCRTTCLPVSKLSVGHVWRISHGVWRFSFVFLLWSNPILLLQCLPTSTHTHPTWERKMESPEARCPLTPSLFRHAERSTRRSTPERQSYSLNSPRSAQKNGRWDWTWEWQNDQV